MNTNALPTVDLCVREDVYGACTSDGNTDAFLSDSASVLFDLMLDDLQKIALTHVSGLTLNPDSNVVENKTNAIITFLRRFDETFNTFIEPYCIDKTAERGLGVFLGSLMTSYCAILEALISAQMELGNIDVCCEDNHEFNANIGATLQRHLDEERARLSHQK